MATFADTAYTQVVLTVLMTLSAVISSPINTDSNVVPAVNPNCKFLLFYTCVTPQVGNQCEEGYTMDQAGIINVGFSDNFTTITTGHDNNISTLFAIHDTFFVNGAGLRPDWQQAWAELQVKLTPLIESKTVIGFFVGDELFPGKITLEDFLTTLKALATMKQKYPWLVTWENEGGTGWVENFKDTGIPEDLDIISLDDYYMGDTPQAEADGHRAFYEKSIYPLLKPHQKVFLVPGSFATHDTREVNGSTYKKNNHTFCFDNTFDSCDDFMVQQANAFAKWASEDTRVAGFAPWHWDTRPIGVVSPYKEVGVVDMPKTKEAWRVIGKMVRANADAAV